MAEGRLAPAPFSNQELNVSAPNYGADFLSEASGFERFPRDKNGLVDINAYSEYLIDHPDDVPTQVTGQGNGYVHQHLYFWRNFYKQKGEPAILRDKLLSSFWESPYNQLLMRPYKERQVHDRFRGLVSPPPIETMKKALIDFGNLDYLGAAALGRRIALLPEAREYIVPGVNAPKAAKNFSPLETARLFDIEIERILETLNQPLVTPQRVITGAISRMSRMLHSESLNEDAERRIDEDPVYYPVRIRKFSDLYSISNTLLKKITSIHVVCEPSSID